MFLLMWKIKFDLLIDLYSDGGARWRAVGEDDDGHAGRAGVVSGTAGDDPDAQVRQRHGHQQGQRGRIDKTSGLPVRC